MKARSTLLSTTRAGRALILAVSVLALVAGSSAAADTMSDKLILTPKPSPAPRINGPKVYGARPGHPFLYRIPCTGQRPITFSAEGLPASLKLDGRTGIISGNTPEKRGDYVVNLRAKNAKGSASRGLKIVVGDALALTPPMGWNDWYTHYDRVTDKLMRDGADAMIASGMADFGYEYINIDDCWMTKPGSKDPALNGEPRDPSGAIRPNGRFPDMRAMTDYIHSKGLKAGLYTSPGPLTCADFTGTYQHEEADARQFAAWGFDFLKYDYCSYDGGVTEGRTVAEYQKPYRLMGGILKRLERDIVYNLCQYGVGDVWQWGGEVDGNSWRTTGDLGLERKKTSLPGFYNIGFQNAQHADYARPGQWNDPDYILIGYVGNAFKSSEPPSLTKLTGDEQYSYMSMWSLMAAPLFFSGDLRMQYLDDFTLNILCNAEVIEVDQDPLGKQARIVRQTNEEFLLAKPLEDGSLAVGLFNLAESPREITVTWQDLGIGGQQRARDLWRQKNIATASDKYSTTVNRHGVALVRLTPAAR